MREYFCKKLFEKAPLMTERGLGLLSHAAFVKIQRAPDRFREEALSLVREQSNIRSKLGLSPAKEIPALLSHRII